MDLDLIQKRRLMKFITTVDQKDSSAFNSFKEYLESFQLDSDLVTMIMLGISLLQGNKDQINGTYKYHWFQGKVCKMD